MKFFTRLSLLASLVLGANTVWAQDLEAIDKQIRASLSMLLPNLKPDAVAETAVPGLYEVTFGARIFYLTGDGRYLMQGKLIDLETRTPITEERQKVLKVAAMEAIGEDNMITFGAADLPHTITVFTDIDCGYCRKLHSEIDNYNEQGIRVRYLAYPRAGLGSPSAKLAESVWCADDRKAAMTTAKKGGDLPSKQCENPVAEHYKLGQTFGINGTPALVLPDGEVIPGYVPPKRLALALAQREAEAQMQAAMKK